MVSARRSESEPRPLIDRQAQALRAQLQRRPVYDVPTPRAQLLRENDTGPEKDREA